MFVNPELSVRIPSDKKESRVAFLQTPFSETLAMSSCLPSSVSSMSEDQVTEMLIRESGGQLTSEMMRQFDVTPRLCAKLLFAICESNNNRIPEGPGVHSRIGEEIDSLAKICLEFLPSASPLTDIIRAIDSDAFIPLNSRVISLKSLSKPFMLFWHFCVELCKTDKQGEYYLIRMTLPV